MRKVTIDVYTFDELSTNAQKRAIEAYRPIAAADEWYEYTFELWQKLLSSIGFDDAKLSFSGFTSQGDGASFTCDNVDVAKFASWLVFNETSDSLDDETERALWRYLNGKLGGNIPLSDDLRRFIGWIVPSDILANNAHCAIVRHLAHYVHHKTISAEFEYCELPLSYHGHLGELCECIESAARQLSAILYRELSDEYDYLTSDDAIREQLTQYEFYENGDVATRD